MLISLSDFRKFFRYEYSFYISDCTITKKNVSAFVLEAELSEDQLEEEQSNSWDPDLRLKALCLFNINKPLEKQWAIKYLPGWKSIINGSASMPAEVVNLQTTSLYPSFANRVFVLGNGQAVEEDPLEPLINGQSYSRGALTKIKTIEGFAYACGHRRSLIRRLEKNTWESFSHRFPYDSQHLFNHCSVNPGFEDVDGWSTSDIYLVGGHGEVWHFDGQSAQQLKFPSSGRLYAICCGGDGVVYIAGDDGFYCGNGDFWTRISGSRSIPRIKDMVWFEDRIWCTGLSGGVYQIHQQKVVIPNLPLNINACAGNLSTEEGLLLMAGPGGAAFKSEGRWQIICLNAEMDALLRSPSGQ